MQVPLITIEGGKPKRRLSWLSAVTVCSLAVLMPVRVRIAFTLAINFIYNHVLATTRMILYFLGRQITQLLILLTYFLVLGPLSIVARLLGRDYLAEAETEGSCYSAKEPADSGAKRFERQY